MKLDDNLTDSDDGLTGAAMAEEMGMDAHPPIYKMQDLMQQIADQSDLKRSDLRQAAGLICAALGQALQQERVLSLPGLGKITPRKRDTKPGGDILTARIKLAKPPSDSQADAGENP